MKRVAFLLTPLLLLAVPAAAQAPHCRPIHEVGTFDNPTLRFSGGGDAFAVSEFVDGKTRFIGAYETSTGRSLGLPPGDVGLIVTRGKRWLRIMSSDFKSSRYYDWRTGAEAKLPAGIRNIFESDHYSVLLGSAPGARVVRTDDLTATVVQFEGLDSARVSDELGLAVAFQPVSSQQGGKPEVLVWDLAAGKETARLRVGRVANLYFQGHYLVINEPDENKKKTMSVWDPRSGRQLGRYAGYDRISWLSLVSPGPELKRDTDSKKGALVHMDEPDRVIEVESDSAVWVEWVAKDRIFARRGGRVVILGRDGRAVLATLADGNKAIGLANGLIGVHIEARAGKRVDILDAESLRPVATLPGREIAEPHLGGRFVATMWSSRDGQSPSALFDTERRAIVCVTPDSTPGYSKAFASPDGKHLAVAWSTSESRRDDKKLVLYAAPDPEAERAKLAEARAKSRGLSPQDKARAQALFKQAFELFQAGEFEAAVRQFDQGLAIDPANGAAHFYLAETYERQQKTARALEHYRRTIDLAPGSKEAAIAETRMGK
jgi:hypothetical protein